MGLKYVNTYFKEKCSKKAIQTIQLRQLYGKQIVIDTSIYIYKFMADNELFENMYILISLFLKYNIIPIFIFDGKPPKQKETLIAERLNEKHKAIQKINELQLEQSQINRREKETFLKELDHYKKKSIIIKDKHIKELKDMMDAFNVTHFTADEEADPVCAYIAKSDNVWGCLSDDMDMFIYGCTRVLRLLNLRKESVLLYDTCEITKELGIVDNMLPSILLLLGTDYQQHNVGITMYTAFQWYMLFMYQNESIQISFYTWLNEKGYINIRQKQELEKISELFCVDNKKYNFQWNVEKKSIQWNQLQLILGKYGFHFLI